MPEFVIVGASLAGAKAAETLRSEGFDGQIALVGEETERPYERPPLSKEYLLGKAPRDTAFVHEQGWYGEHQIELMLGVRATMLDPAAHIVTLDGFDPVHYDKLLLATGSRPRRLDVPGADLSGVRYLRTIIDSDVLVDRIVPGTSAVIIGSGWIGLEVAAAVISRGGTAAVVGTDTLPLRKVLGDELATIYADLHRSKGVTFHFGTHVASFEGTSGSLTTVRLADGTEIAATLAVVGVGIQPNVELAAAGGLEIDNGVVTDAALRTSDPDIYACGDVASSVNPLLGTRVRLEHWANALNAGPAAAKSMLGQDISYDRVPYFYSDQYDLSMEYAGYVPSKGYDSVVFRGDTTMKDGKAPAFLAFWIKDGRVLAGMNANIFDVQDDIQQLVRAGYGGASVDLAQLADPNVPLGSLVH
jgi:3-phenylpropionate/trans-cinnamate dioxygenase ferredoxin reductase subunit